MTNITELFLIIFVIAVVFTLITYLINALAMIVSYLKIKLNVNTKQAVNKCENCANVVMIEKTIEKAENTKEDTTNIIQFPKKVDSA